MDWNGQDGCFVLKMKIGHSVDGMKACFNEMITHMQSKKFHIVDLFLQKVPGL